MEIAPSRIHKIPRKSNFQATWQKPIAYSEFHGYPMAVGVRGKVKARFCCGHQISIAPGTGKVTGGNLGVPNLFLSFSMAAISYCTGLPTASDFQASCLTFQTAGRQALLRRSTHRKRFGIRAEIDYVNADDAKKLVAGGYAVVDVRDKSQFERAHIKSCYHVPLFIENQDNDPGTIIKRTLHNNFSGLFYGLPFTKPNPEFVQSVKSQFSPNSKLLLVCQEGLRSTAAARKLEEAGFQNIACITSGLQSVKPGMFDSVGSTELQDAGKAGLVTIQGKISVVLGTVLICALMFVSFFPDQAEQLLAMVPGS